MNFAGHARSQNCRSLPPRSKEGIHGSNPFVFVFSRNFAGKSGNGSCSVSFQWI